MASSTHLLGKKGQIFIENLLLLILVLGTLTSLSVFEKIAKKETYKYRLHKKYFKKTHKRRR